MVELYSAFSSPRLLAAPLRVSAIGDSIQKDAFAVGAGWTNWGYLSWMRRFLGDRIDFPGERNYAIASKKVSEIYADQYPVALADSSNIVFDNSGTNSISVETTDAIITQKKAMYDGFRQAGKSVVITGIRAHKSPAAFTPDQKKIVAYVNNYFRNYAAANNHAIFFDPDPAIIDWSTGDVLAAPFRDGIHDNQLSARNQGKRIADLLSPFMLLLDKGPVNVGDIFDATLNPTGNLLTNGLLAGTSGTVSNGATGTPPTSWIGQRSATGVTDTVAVSKEADAAYSTLEKAVLTLGGTGQGSQLYITQTFAMPAGINIGDTLELQAFAEWSLNQPLIAIAARLCFRDAAQAALVNLYDGNFSSVNGPLPAGDTGSGLFKIRGPVPANTANLQVYLVGIPAVGGSVDAVIKWSRASLRKVI